MNTDKSSNEYTVANVVELSNAITKVLDFFQQGSRHERPVPPNAHEIQSVAHGLYNNNIESDRRRIELQMLLGELFAARAHLHAAPLLIGRTGKR